MERITVQKVKTLFQPGDYPKETVGTIIDKPCLIFDKAENLLAAYYAAPKEIVTLARTITKNTKPKKSTRTAHGVPQLSTVYGPLPRITIREDYCRFSRQTKEEKANMALAMKLNQLLSKFYEANLPEFFSAAIKRVEEEVHSDYRLTNTPWTNININLNQVIKYHRDKGNNPVDLSNVLIIKENCNGGYLACPEYNVTFHQGDGFMVFFKGQEILHGVTPCTFMGANSYRSSIVNYTLKNLKHCYPYEQELERLKLVKSTQALNRKKTNFELAQYLQKRKTKNGQA